MPVSANSSLNNNAPLRHYAKVICFATLFLIFAGGMVTSTGSGLAVPDWPLSYGTLFPPMVGGIFYEHGHRMVAATVGFLVLCFTIWLHRKEKRIWVKYLGLTAFGLVIIQGVLGGITVKFFLPPVVSITHGVIAQTFFILTVILAYVLSFERDYRQTTKEVYEIRFLRLTLMFSVLVYFQLILGAIMRHSHSGLAIFDFPTMASSWWPQFNDQMLKTINNWRFDHDLPGVTMGQALIHFSHRLMALLIVFMLCLLNFLAFKSNEVSMTVKKTIGLLDLMIITQITLGIYTVLTIKNPIITSFHVAMGAATLGVSVLLLLRMYPLSIRESVKLVS